MTTTFTNQSMSTATKADSVSEFCFRSISHVANLNIHQMIMITVSTSTKDETTFKVSTNSRGSAARLTGTGVTGGMSPRSVLTPSRYETPLVTRSANVSGERDPPTLQARASASRSAASRSASRYAGQHHQVRELGL